MYTQKSEVQEIMSQKISHISSRLVVPSDVFEQDNGAESAQGLVDVPGLLWKIAYINRESMEAGGIYLFKDEATLQAYIEGPIVVARSGSIGSNLPFSLLRKPNMMVRKE
jgi:hypothetical protein